MLTAARGDEYLMMNSIDVMCSRVAVTLYYRAPGTVLDLMYIYNVCICFTATTTTTAITTATTATCYCTLYIVVVIRV